MWRVTAMARLPKSSSSSSNSSSCIKAGTRRCFRDMRASSSATATATATTTTIISEPNASNIPYAYRQQRHQKWRYFHTTASIAATKPSWDTDASDTNDFLDGDDNDYTTSNDGAVVLDEEEERERYRLNQEIVNHELDSRKGRPWKDPWEIREEQWMASDTSSDNLPDWNPSYVSRISLERLQILPIDEDRGIPTLQEILELSLPGSDPELHPTRKTKTYAAYRKSKNYAIVKDCVSKLAKDRVETLLKEAAAAAAANSSISHSNPSDQQQKSVDALFEDLQEEATADASMDILSKHPAFPSWVDRGLEEYLRTAQQEALQMDAVAASSEPSETEGTKSDALGSEEREAATASASNNNNDSEATTIAPPQQPAFREHTPVFMDCYDPSEAAAANSSDDTNALGPIVPSILTPLGPHRHGGPGRMVEEWELSAHSTTKRIMLRECTQEVARLLIEAEEDTTTAAAAAPKIYVHGTQGVGKSALLASIVAAARTSGSIVLYLPDGDRLRKNGFFITPSTHPNRTGMFDLQDLSQEALKQLMGSHDATQQMEGMVADRATLEAYFKETQFKKLDEFRADRKIESDEDDGDGSVSLLDLIAYSQENKKHAPMCYSVVIDRLMNQTDKKFMIVMDEFNCLFDKGHYFHMAYDEDVKEAIPHHKINLFEPILKAMNISTKTVEEEEDDSSEETESSSSSNNNNNTFTGAHTAVLVGTSECHAVPKGITAKLTECAVRNDAISVVEVPRFSSVEADHVLANFEATGVGKLRLDRGDTLMNTQEMEYLKMSSGSIGQKLLDVSIF